MSNTEQSKLYLSPKRVFAPGTTKTEESLKALLERRKYFSVPVLTIREMRNIMALEERIGGCAVYGNMIISIAEICTFDCSFLIHPSYSVIIDEDIKAEDLLKLLKSIYRSLECLRDEHGVFDDWVEIFESVDYLIGLFKREFARKTREFLESGRELMEQEKSYFKLKKRNREVRAREINLVDGDEDLGEELDFSHLIPGEEQLNRHEPVIEDSEEEPPKKRFFVIAGDSQLE